MLLSRTVYTFRIVFTCFIYVSEFDRSTFATRDSLRVFIRILFIVSLLQVFYRFLRAIDKGIIFRLRSNFVTIERFVSEDFLKRFEAMANESVVSLVVGFPSDFCACACVCVCVCARSVS